MDDTIERKYFRCERAVSPFRRFKEEIAVKKRLLTERLHRSIRGCGGYNIVSATAP